MAQKPLSTAPYVQRYCVGERTLTFNSFSRLFVALANTTPYHYTSAKSTTPSTYQIRQPPKSSTPPSSCLLSVSLSRHPRSKKVFWNRSHHSCPQVAYKETYIGSRP